MKAVTSGTVTAAGMLAPRSMLMLGAQVRFGLAATLVGALWLAVWWALA
jgi:hypothetical protein